MARNDSNTRTTRNRTSQQQRDRSTGRIGSLTDSVRSRPIAAAAVVATAAAAAGAFFLSRRNGLGGSQPLMKWGQADDADLGKDTGNQEALLETASATPSASAGLGAGSGGSSPTEIGGKNTGKFASKASTSSGTSTVAQAGSDGSGLDQTSKDDTKVGAIAY